ncbi:MAG: hypothetical protein HOG79_02450, partial [Prolixibacteraceae bacterium]|nr:hypothetical protein [Prolixibacteraceae bacterium]
MKTNVRWIFSIIFLFVSLNCNAQLTGIWQDDNGTRYSIRQIGNEIFWRMDGLPHVINVFSGTIAGNTITGEWADLPGGNKLGTGTIALKLETRDRMVRISKNDNYGASQWVRIPVFVEPAGPTTQNTQTQTTQTQSNQTTSQRTA